MVVEIDMDRVENKGPEQCLEDTEVISTLITPISTFDSFVDGSEANGWSEVDMEKEGNVITAAVHVLSSVLSQRSLFSFIDGL